MPAAGRARHQLPPAAGRSPQALAEEFLATGGLTPEEIAERLGYGEVSNFLHAFKHRKGQTTRQYLKERQT